MFHHCEKNHVRASTAVGFQAESVAAAAKTLSLSLFLSFTYTSTNTLTQAHPNTLTRTHALFSLHPNRQPTRLLIEASVTANTNQRFQISQLPDMARTKMGSGSEMMKLS